MIIITNIFNLLLSSILLHRQNYPVKQLYPVFLGVKTYFIRVTLNAPSDLEVKVAVCGAGGLAMKCPHKTSQA